MNRLPLALALALALLAAGAGSASAAIENFSTTAPIAINAVAGATPYPAKLDVQGMPGRLTDVSVALRGFKHDRPTDVDVLLLAPDGRGVVLMSDGCGSSPVTGLTLVFNQQFKDAVPAGAPCDTLYFRPTNHPPGDNWPNTPPGVYAPADLDHLVGGEPNGTWKLYVWDDLNSKTGRIGNGWVLTVSSEVPDAVVPAPGGPGTADPYPLTRTVSGVDGLITDVDVKLEGIFHERPIDLDVLLVGPRGQRVMLMSDACGRGRAKAMRWGWNDEAAGQMNDSEYACPPDFAYVPTDWEPGESLPAPAPPGPYGDRLSDFDFTDPNGDWRLYVADDVPGDREGFFTRRFTVELERACGRAACRAVATLRRAGRPGANRIALTGRIGRRALRPGRYRLRVTATDAAGNRSRTRTRTFRIVRSTPRRTHA